MKILRRHQLGMVHVQVLHDSCPELIQCASSRECPLVTQQSPHCLFSGVTEKDFWCLAGQSDNISSPGLTPVCRLEALHSLLLFCGEW